MSETEYEKLAAQIAREEARLREIEAEQAAARRRLKALSAKLDMLHQPDPGDPVSPQSNDQKVALFRSLFRGRTDVFPKRWQNQNKQTSGYAPACANEWVRGVCEKPRVKCGECTNQAFIAVTDQVIADHLRGRHVAGVYPLLEDETCHFLALDFDKADWKNDVAAFRSTCEHFGLNAAVERSRSGKGAHVWFFFAERVPASEARTMGCSLITEAMSQRNELPMSSYDRLFPSQDTMPRGGFGNLIALPLQFEARQRDNSVFVDESWDPHTDQWAYLAGLPRIDRSQVKDLARDAVERRRVVGVPVVQPTEGVRGQLRLEEAPGTKRIYISEPLPPRVCAVLGSELVVNVAGLPSVLIDQMKRLAAFENPEFYKKQAMRMSTALTPRVISCAEEAGDRIGLPRGCLHALEGLVDQHEIELAIDDQRSDGEAVGVEFHGELTGIQQQAARSLLAHDIGVFVAPPGSGKTVLGTHLVAARGRSTLVLVHRTQLLDQWRTQLSVYLDLKPSEIGQIGGGRQKPTGYIDIGMLQSLVRRDRKDVSGYGHVIVDECHHVPAVSFEKVMRRVRARYITGLTATPQRRDGHHPILHFQLGPIRFSVDSRSEKAARRLEHQVIIRQTLFRLQDQSSESRIQEIYEKLANDRSRNEMILDDVICALEEGRSPILLTERRDHLDYFASQLTNVARHLVVLRGGMGVRRRDKVRTQLNDIPDNEERLILATGRFIGEGFDDARLDTLFLAMPISWKGTLVQYAGRLHRRHPRKSDVRIYDYVDADVPMLAKMYQRRLKGYRAMGYDLRGPEQDDNVGKGDYVVEYDQDVLQTLGRETF